MTVEVGHIAAAPRWRVELGGQCVGFAALAHEVVGGNPHLAAGGGGHARLLVGLAEDGQDAVEQHLALDETLEAQRQVLDHAAADISSGGRAALVAEDVADERVQVARVRGEVVEAVGRESRVAEPAQVGHYHLEASLRQGPDVAPPDALRLGPAVHEQQRVAADALAYVGQLDALANLSVLNRERAGAGAGAHARHATPRRGGQRRRLGGCRRRCRWGGTTGS